MAEIYELVLVVLTLFTAFFAVSYKKMYGTVVAFLFMSTFIALLFFLLGAPYAAVFQLLIYTGAVVILILITIHTIERWE